MFEKEILTKKQMVKIIMPKLRDVIAVTFAILLVMLFFGLMSNWIHKNIATAMFEYEAVIFTIFSKICKWIAIFCGICLRLGYAESLRYDRSGIWDLAHCDFHKKVKENLC